MSELNHGSSDSSSAQGTAGLIVVKSSSGFIKSWLGMGLASWSLRKRMIAILRLAHRVLGTRRKHLGLGSLGIGLAAARIVLAASASGGVVLGAISSAFAAPQYVGGLFASVGYGSGGGPGSTTMECKDLVYQSYGQSGSGNPGPGDTHDGPGGTNTSLNYYGSNVICGSSDAATQTNRILAYADSPTTNATNMTIGGKLFVNGTTTLNNLVVTGSTTFNGSVAIKYFHANSTLADGTVTGTDSLVVGPGTTASHANSIALGTGSATTVGAQTGYVAYGLAGAQNSSGELNIGGRKITGVAPGSAATDAANVNQLNQVAQNTATSMGGGAAYNAATGAYTAPSYVLSTGSATDVGTALSNVDTRGTRYFRANSTGTGSQATGTDAMAVGPSSVAAGNSAVAMGPGASATTDESVAIGMNAAASGGKSVSIGSGNRATGNGAVGIGDPNIVNGTGAVTVGANNTATADGTATGGSANGAVAIGNTNVAAGQGSVAIGNMSQANNAGSIALGDTANVAATATRGVAIGSGTSVTGANSVALGAGSTDGGQANVVSVGQAGAERKIINVAPGRLSAISTDAVNGAQLFATNQNVATNTANIATLGQSALQWDSTASAFSAVHGSTAPQKITNLAAGTLSATSTDAVNGAQLNTTNQNVASLSTQINSGSVGLVQQPGGAGNNLTVGASTDGAAVDFKGTAGNRKLIDVAAGTVAATSTDAVNGAQLFATNAAIATALGGGASVNGAGALTGPSYALSTGTVTNVGAALTNIDALGTRYFRANSTAAASQATGTDALALGPGSVASGNSSIAMGSNATAGGGKAIAIGAGNSAFGDGTVALGDPNVASGSGAVALGANNIANSDGTPSATATNQAQGAVAIGNSNTAVGQGSIALGNGSFARNAGSIALGDAANVATGATRGVALGSGTSVMGANSVAIGANSADGGQANVVSVGQAGAERKIINVAAGMLSATSTDAVNGTQLFTTNQNVAAHTASIAALNQDALKWDSTRNAFSAVHGSTTPQKITNLAAGTLSATSSDAVNGSQLFALGSSAATVLGGTTSYNLLTGQLTGGFTYNGTAFSSVQSVFNAINSSVNGGAGIKYIHVNSTLADSQAIGTDSTAIGPQSVASGNASIALGNGTTATGQRSIALGNASTASTNGSIAIGDQANVGTAASTGVALGSGASVTGANSVAIGAGSTDGGQANVVSVGVAGAERKIINVALGTLSATSTDAVNGSQLFATNQVVANLANGSAGLVRQSGPNAEITVGATTGGTAVNFVNAAGGNRQLTHIADGVASTDAVNKGQLDAVSNLSVKYDTDSSGNRANSITLVGAANGQTVKITNLADGVAQTDAVNMRQLMVLGGGSIRYDNNPDGTQNRTSLTFNPGGPSTALHNVAPGIAGTDAVNLNQLISTSMSGRAYTDTQVNGLRSEMYQGFAALDSRIRDVQKEARQGIAAAMAMTSTGMPSAPYNTNWAVNTALFKGEVGLGASFAHRFDSRIPLALTGGLSWGGNDNLGVRVGLMGQF